MQTSLTLKIIRKKSVEVSMGEGATFVIILHQAWRRNPTHGDFLGFYALDSHRLSEHTHGLLGRNLCNIFDVQKLKGSVHSI